jgi:hypothetical protein
MKVMFSKCDGGRLCTWRAELPKHRQILGSTMGTRAARTDLPHDLAQFVVEVTLGPEEGFWNWWRMGPHSRASGGARPSPDASSSRPTVPS